MKSCVTCKVEKELDCFSKDKKRPDGYYVYCKECVKETSRLRYINNKDKMSKASRKWKQDNKESYLAQQREYKKEYIKTPNHKFREYKTGALDRNYAFELTFEQFMIYWQKPCQYCGSEIDTIGLDRVDNTQGYNIDNLKTCCFWCNRSKDTHTEQEYIEHCRKVVEFANAR